MFAFGPALIFKEYDYAILSSLAVGPEKCQNHLYTHELVLVY